MFPEVRNLLLFTRENGPHVHPKGFLHRPNGQ